MQRFILNLGRCLHHLLENSFKKLPHVCWSVTFNNKKHIPWAKRGTLRSMRLLHFFWILVRERFWMPSTTVNLFTNRGPNGIIWLDPSWPEFFKGRKKKGFTGVITYNPTCRIILIWLYELFHSIYVTVFLKHLMVGIYGRFGCIWPLFRRGNCGGNLRGTGVK